ncbi:MAG: YHS domain-containing (seleno)protein [Humidesulfovibrio sp.]
MKRHSLILALILALLLLCLAGSTAFAAKSAVNTGFIGDVAVEGADVVAYFTQGKYVAGTWEFSLRWNEADWRFSSAEHLRLFSENPEKYAPRYGGYCAYAVAQGTTAGINPEAWSIVEGRLYLNYSKSVRETWLKNTRGYIEQADRNWPGVLER